MPAPDSDNLSDTSLCVGCGLCCDGTLHAKTTVKPDDEAIVAAAGLEVVEDGEKRSFRQPCPHFSCGQCSIYAARPGVCRTYRCALLKRYQAGEVPIAEARATVEKALDLVSAVKADDELAALYNERRALRGQLAERMKSASGERRRGLARRLLNIVALDEFLHSRFRRKKKAPDRPIMPESGILPIDV